MDTLFSADYQLFWTGVLAVGLFFPVRQMIWVLAVRRHERKEGPGDEETRTRLRRRSGVTAALLCFVFSVFYTNYLFQG